MPAVMASILRGSSTHAPMLLVARRNDPQNHVQPEHHGRIFSPAVGAAEVSRRRKADRDRGRLAVRSPIGPTLSDGSDAGRHARDGSTIHAERNALQPRLLDGFAGVAQFVETVSYLRYVAHRARYDGSLNYHDREVGP